MLRAGLLYLRARYYDPSIAFISADPYQGRIAEPVTQNRYIYVHNNPLWFVDLSGMCSILDTYTLWIDCMFDSFGLSTTLIGAGVSLIYDTGFQVAAISPGDEVDMTVGFSKYLSIGSNNAANKISYNVGLGIGLPISFGKELGVFDLSHADRHG